jgi:DNA-binding beta-propeller fold protein YncE
MGILQMSTKSIYIFLLLISTVLLAGCGLDQKGLVIMTDHSYRPSVVGTNEDGFTSPDGLLWKEGKLYMADEGGNAFRIWSGPNHSITLCDASIGVMSPEDLVVDNQGNIFFTDDDAGGVWKIDNLGNSSRFVTPEQGPISTEGIVLNPDQSIFIGDGEVHKVFRVTQNGEVSVFLGEEYGITKAESMVYTEKGDLYIADNEDNVLYLLTPDKKLHRTIENQPGFSPETIWYDKGVLYITDSRDHKLFRYTPEDGLRTIAIFGGVLQAVNGITTDDKGDIYISVQTDLKRRLGYVLKLEPIK